MGFTVPLYASGSLFSSAFWVSFGAWAVMEWWIAARDLRAAKGQNRDAFTKLVFYVCMPAGMFGGFFAAWRFPAGAIDLWPEPVFWSGVVLIWAGMALRLWAVLTLGRFFRTSVFLHDDHRLVTAGPYRILRHPSYTGGLISMVGIGLAMLNWASLASVVGGIAICYAFRIPAEERALKQHFGEAFAAYRKGRWALIPLVW